MGPSQAKNRSGGVRLASGDQPTRQKRRGRCITSLLAALMAVGALQIGPASKAYADQQGALALGQTDYAVPAGAFFVSPTGSDANAGTQAAPWRTLTHAVNTAPSGSTIVIRGGTYGEQVNVLRSLTIQPYPGEKVWLTGSDVVTGWVADAGAWRKDGWTPSFTHADSSTTVAIDPAYPLAGWPEMVFVNGAALRQVASRAEVVTGTFYVDDAGDRLYVGTDPTGRLVEASARGEALSLRSPGSVVRGLGFRHYATPFLKKGAVKGYADRVVFENNVFVDNALAGLSVIGADAKVVRNTMAGNGQLGFHSHLSDRLVVEGNRVAGNNTERFHIAQAAGGAKITTSRDILVRANTVEENHGNGLWLDVSVYGANVVGNLLRNNYRSGLQFEISANALVASNVAVGNRERGIYVLDSSDVEIWNNTLSRNGRNIFILEGNRTSTVDPAITWDVARVNIRNNVLSESTATTYAALLGVDDARKLTSGAGMGVTADYDAFYRVSATSPSWVGVWSNWPTSMLVATTLDKFRTMTGQEQHGMLTDGGPNPFIADEDAGDYAIPSTSPAWEKGTPLPARVASAMGVAAGVPVNIGVLVQPFRSAPPPPPPPNQPPVATFAATCAELTCTFDGKASTDPDGLITAWSWSFGDNTSGTGVTSSHTYAAAGSFTVTLTVTDDKGATVTASQTVSPALPPDVLALDGYGRSADSGWGATDNGHPYTIATTTAADFAVSNGAATVRVPTAGLQRRAQLATVSVRDVALRTKVSTDKAALGGTHGQTLALAARRTADDSEYRGRLRFSPDGRVLVAAVKVAGSGPESVIGTEAQVTGLVHAPNQFYWVATNVMGANPTTIAVKAWADGQSEPTTWPVLVTDATPALQVGGTVGITPYLSSESTNAPITFSVDDLKVAKGANVGTPPTVPSAPMIVLTGVTSTSVSLAWNAPSGADTYEVERSTAGGATWVVAASGLSVPSFTDVGLVRNTAYQYRVRAKNASGFSPYSAVLSVKTKSCRDC